MMQRTICLLVLAALFATSPASQAAGAEAGIAPAAGRQTVRPFGIPGEFERQAAILLSWDYDEEIVQPVTLSVIAAIWAKVPVVLLVPDSASRTEALAAFRRLGIPRHAVRFVQIPFDTIWARDYGPMIVRSAAGEPVLVDADYERGARTSDDEVPARMAPLLRIPAVRAPISIEGGNLLSNGAGLCLTTYSVVENNADRGYDEDETAEVIKRHYGVREVVFLEPLVGEPTGHIDMFATFTSANTVVVGEYPAHLDPVNSELLDRNAERLSRIQTPHGPLNVVRIPMPPHDADCWPTYTNVLYANGRVLVPTYPNFDPDDEEEVFDTFRRLLPGWTVVGIDCGEIIGFGGAVHCISMNLSRVTRLPAADRLEVPQGAPVRDDAPLAARPFDADADDGLEAEELFGRWNLEGLTWFDLEEFEADGDEFDEIEITAAPHRLGMDHSPDARRTLRLIRRYGMSGRWSGK